MPPITRSWTTAVTNAVKTYECINIIPTPLPMQCYPLPMGTVVLATLAYREYLDA